jgi:integrase
MAAETFEATIGRYLNHQRSRLRARSFPGIERHLLKHAKMLHKMELAKIERRDIATVITAAAESSGQVTGNRVRSSLSSFFSWAMTQGLVDTSPVIGTLRHEERSRERMLDPSELRILWNSFTDDHFGSVLKLRLLTGQRPGEIAGLRWSEVRDHEITLPPNGQKTIVAMSSRFRRRRVKSSTSSHAGQPQLVSRVI